MPAIPTTLTTQPRVLVVDEDRRVQQSLAGCLELTGRIKIIGTTGDVRTALQLVERDAPDVVLMDPRLPDLDAGAALVSSIGLTRAATRVVLTGWGAELERPEMLNTGCSYVSKNASPEEFIAAVLACCEAPAQTAV